MTEDNFLILVLNSLLQLEYIYDKMNKITKLQDMYHHMVENYQEMNEQGSPTSAQGDGKLKRS